METSELMIRPAELADVEKMQALINNFAAQEKMLSRTLFELYCGIRDYRVLVRGGEIIGTCALQIAWRDLAEVKALTVVPEFQGQGSGRLLVEDALLEARQLGIKQVFTLTYVSGFFLKLGFKPVGKETLPQKVWMECVRCVKFPDCDEQALVVEL